MKLQAEQPCSIQVESVKNIYFSQVISYYWEAFWPKIVFLALCQLAHSYGVLKFHLKYSLFTFYHGAKFILL